MKKLILLTIMTTFAMSGFINEADTYAQNKAKENDRLCKIFTTKVEKYKSTMRNDGLADATLDSYEKRMNVYCASTDVKSKVKTIEEVQKEVAVTSGLKADSRLCNVFTKKVKKYESSMRNDELAKATLDSYKKRQASFCASDAKKS